MTQQTAMELTGKARQTLHSYAKQGKIKIAFRVHRAVKSTAPRLYYWAPSVRRIVDTEKKGLRRLVWVWLGL